MREVIREPLETVAGAGHRLGDFIREQRRGSQISLRQLADLAGVSNPYLSQIERGLRKPSAEILQQIAKGLRISAEALYLQAGILEQRDGDPAVAEAILADPVLTERQKQVLLEIYESFRREVGVAPTSAAANGAADTAPAVKRLRRSAAASTPSAGEAARPAAARPAGRRVATPSPRPAARPAPARAATTPEETST